MSISNITAVMIEANIFESPKTYTKVEEVITKKDKKKRQTGQEIKTKHRNLSAFSRKYQLINIKNC